MNGVWGVEVVFHCALVLGIYRGFFQGRYIVCIWQKIDARGKIQFRYIAAFSVRFIEPFDKAGSKLFICHVLQSIDASRKR